MSLLPLWSCVVDIGDRVAWKSLDGVKVNAVVVGVSARTVVTVNKVRIDEEDGRVIDHPWVSVFHLGHDGVFYLDGTAHSKNYDCVLLEGHFRDER